MAKYTKQEWESIVVPKQIKAFKREYLAKQINKFVYNAFLKQRDYLLTKIKSSSLDNKEKERLLSEINSLNETIAKKYNPGNSKKLPSTPTQYTQSTQTQPTQISANSPQNTLQNSSPDSSQKYGPKGEAGAKRNYYLVLGKISRLESYCKKMGSSEFSAKEFYSLLNEIENQFIRGRLHGDDIRHLWQKYKQLKEKAKETLSKESEKSRKSIEELVEKGLNEIEKGNTGRAKRMLFKTFDLFKGSSMSRQDKDYCNEKIGNLKTMLNEALGKYKEEFKRYEEKAKEILNSVNLGSSSPYIFVESIQDLRIEMKAMGIKKEDYKRIDIFLNKAWKIASKRIALEREKRQETRLEKKARVLSEKNETRKALIEQVQKEINDLKTSAPFSPKIAEKEKFIKRLKEQIKETEKKINKLYQEK